MMANEHGVDARFPTTAERHKPTTERFKQAMRMTMVGLLISLAYVAWVGMALFSTFDLA